MTEFDKKIERLGTDSVKYDGVKRYFGVEDVKPLWVADMDFETLDFIKEAVVKRADHQIYGYEELGKSFYDAVSLWMEKRHSWQIEKKWISFVPGVVAGLSAAVEAFSQTGDEVIVQTPVYYPFFSVVKQQNRKLITNPLKEENGHYTIDFKDLQSKVTEKTKLLLFCSPHNPVGRVWSKKELEKLAEICMKNNITVVADEIHSDIVFKKFTPFASLSKEVADITVTLNAPSKTFNLAGLHTSYSIIKNQDRKERFDTVLKTRSQTMPNIFGTAALVAAYTKGDSWLKDLLHYLDGNFQKVIEILEDTKIKTTKPEATYLMWLNFREYGLNQKELERKLLNEAKTALNNGVSFGRNGNGFFRLNVALPREELEIHVRKIGEAFKVLKE